ncbi:MULTISPECIES: GNAT family N-acetyltransferase [unclassified Imperialibacter]|uniref:GNAT family N-acetyltransferase n=1 Tax=unclassified Imperialibacter TaxID=2629706 RepID=UPI0012593A0F|nr:MULTISPECIES: GNAT family N-acetyltransferase [unclassified Imperialibacter]CAD5295406.1 GNAT family N-acetyltransferase [Imperialibacter sp. 75]CAD5296120.1 GNAT family N-acetyltransferase [Imperialibacter sp. 89]VVT14876.1 GNAT family N-acetyltransferase [Imperialibacter sp. EC-SDR9]
MNSIVFSTPESNGDLQQILDLQEVNQPHNITPEQLAKEGFVTVRHHLDLLRSMNDSAPQIIAKDGEKVVGYALVMLQSFQDLIPVLKPMFVTLETLTYRDRPMPSYQYYAMGQICVAEGYRGMGIFDGMYQKHKALYANQFDLCVTEIASRNPRSLRAHQRVGFQTIHTFTDATDTWDIVAWDWK